MLYSYFKSDAWSSPVQTFIENNCLFFTEAQPTLQEEREQKEIHKEFTLLIDELIQVCLREFGIDQAAFLKACNEAKGDKEQWKIIRQILLVEDFKYFRGIMIKRNQDLERKALSLMLQNEEQNLRNARGQVVHGHPVMA